ncbi:MAG: hypothetical protein JW791_02360 [Nanoarchaeota archaeon]|nr:hypothetical protein [Nanoarchaeota archaeon]
MEESSQYLVTIEQINAYRSLVSEAVKIARKRELEDLSDELDFNNSIGDYSLTEINNTSKRLIYLTKVAELAKDYLNLEEKKILLGGNVFSNYVPTPEDLNNPINFLFKITEVFFSKEDDQYKFFSLLIGDKINDYHSLRREYKDIKHNEFIDRLDYFISNINIALAKKEVFDNNSIENVLLKEEDIEEIIKTIKEYQNTHSNLLDENKIDMESFNQSLFDASFEEKYGRLINGSFIEEYRSKLVEFKQRFSEIKDLFEKKEAASEELLKEFCTSLLKAYKPLHKIAKSAVKEFEKMEKTDRELIALFSNISQEISDHLKNSFESSWVPLKNELFLRVIDNYESLKKEKASGNILKSSFIPNLKDYDKGYTFLAEEGMKQILSSWNLVKDNKSSLKKRLKGLKKVLSKA